jgi:hypothetical protein
LRLLEITDAGQKRHHTRPFDQDRHLVLVFGGSGSIGLVGADLLVMSQRTSASWHARYQVDCKGKRRQGHHVAVPAEDDTPPRSGGFFCRSFGAREPAPVAGLRDRCAGVAGMPGPTHGARMWARVGPTCEASSIGYFLGAAMTRRIFFPQDGAWLRSLQKTQVLRA